MSTSPDPELARKFRVVQQTLTMQRAMHDRYARRALILDLILIGCSVVFCATTFASDETLEVIGISADPVRVILGWAAIAAFFGSLASLIFDWKGKAGKHGAAARKLADVQSLFRDVREEDGMWPARKKRELQRAYWDAMNNDAPIPDRLFAALKARHLRKIELGKMLDKNPGCPVWLLSGMLFCRSLSKVGRTWRRLGQDAQNAAEAYPDKPE